MPFTVPYEPCDMSVHQAVLFSAPPVLPLVSYSSGRPRSWRELVCEHANAAVLRLDGVVADPACCCRRSGCRRIRNAADDLGPTAPDAAVGVRAVAPDGVGALGAAAGLLALAGVDRLEVVDVAVRLVEVAVVVEVVAVPDVERREQRVDLRWRLAAAISELYQAVAWSRMKRPTSRVQTMLPQ